MAFLGTARIAVAFCMLTSMADATNTTGTVSATTTTTTTTTSTYAAGTSVISGSIGLTGSWNTSKPASEYCTPILLALDLACNLQNGTTTGTCAYGSRRLAVDDLEVEVQAERRLSSSTLNVNYTIAVTPTTNSSSGATISANAVTTSINAISTSSTTFQSYVQSTVSSATGTSVSVTGTTISYSTVTVTAATTATTTSNVTTAASACSALSMWGLVVGTLTMWRLL